MKEVIMKFETIELYNEFIEEVVNPSLALTVSPTKMEYDFENDICNVSVRNK